MIGTAGNSAVLFGFSGWQGFCNIQYECQGVTEYLLIVVGGIG